MSDHHHLVLTDVNGVLPDFLRELHRTVAKALNASQGQWENLWSLEPTNVVHLGDSDDVIRKMAYVVTNPVVAGLVASPAEWPGVNLWGEHELQVQRPYDYFAADGRAPESLPLRIQFPAVNAGCSPPRDRLADLMAARVEEAHLAVKAAGISFPHPRAAESASFLDRAKGYEVKRGIVPTIAAADAAVRKSLLRARQQFLAGYYAALKMWRQGVRGALFPYGTWWLRIHHGAAVTPAACVLPSPAPA
jgi:putative transposase